MTFDPDKRQHEIWTAENSADGKYSHAIPVTPEYYSSTEFDEPFYEKRRDECDRLIGGPTQPINYHDDPNTEIPGSTKGFNIFVANKPLVWNDLPTNDPDNDTLELLDTYRYSFTKTLSPNVPANLVPSDAGETVETDAYKYKADFAWNNQSRNKSLAWLLDVERFAYNQIDSAVQAFYLAGSLVRVTALKDLDTSNLNSMYRMFSYCKWFNQPVNHLDTSKVTNMESMFSVNYAFDQPLDNFDTSKVTVMHRMFQDAYSFNQDISDWCVEKIPWKPNFFDDNTLMSQSPEKLPNWAAPC